MSNAKVNDYIKKQPLTHQKIFKHLRQLLFKVIPGIDEEFAWGVPVYDGGRFYLASLKKQVNFGVSIVGLSKQEIAMFDGSGRTARHIKVHSLREIDEKQIVKVIKLVHKKSSPPPDYK